MSSKGVGVVCHWQKRALRVLGEVRRVIIQNTILGRVFYSVD